MQYLSKYFLLFSICQQIAMSNFCLFASLILYPCGLFYIFMIVSDLWKIFSHHVYFGKFGIAMIDLWKIFGIWGWFVKDFGFSGLICERLWVIRADLWKILGYQGWFVKNFGLSGLICGRFLVFRAGLWKILGHCLNRLSNSAVYNCLFVIYNPL